MTGSRNSARQYALKLLSYRGRSEKELEKRLWEKGITKSEASSTIQYLKEIGLINDVSLAEALKREALTTKLLSQRGAKSYMLQRGIPREIVDQVFQDYEDTDIENAVRIADKRIRKSGNRATEVQRRRLYNLLLRRGYSSGTIMKVLRDKNLKEEDQE